MADAVVGRSSTPFVTYSLYELRKLVPKDEEERKRIDEAISEREKAGVHIHANGSWLERQLYGKARPLIV